MKNQLEKLQDKLALIDLMSRPRRGNYSELLIKELLPLEVRMEQDKNHKRPHVHINYGKQKHVASYAIDNGERLVGDLSSKYDKVVTSWINENQARLLQIWTEMQAGNQNQYEFLIGQL
jgi:hypothetical protein